MPRIATTALGYERLLDVRLRATTRGLEMLIPLVSLTRALTSLSRGTGNLISLFVIR
jgi:hypothetical protein